MTTTTNDYSAASVICQKCNTDEYFNWAINGAMEDGWYCRVCKTQPGNPPGFSPGLDRQRTYVKVQSIMYLLAGIVTGYSFIRLRDPETAIKIAEDVCQTCQQAQRYDQQTIVANVAGHPLINQGQYWQSISEQILSNVPAQALRESLRRDQ